jgi:hypothetical protein
LDLTTNFKSNPCFREIDEKAAETIQNSVHTHNHHTDNRASNSTRLQHEHTNATEYRKSNSNNDTTDNGRNFSSANWCYYSHNIVDRGLRFFSRKTQLHYEQLDQYIFSVLRKNLVMIDTHHAIGDSLTIYYSVIPTGHRLYSDAVLHMKKEDGKETLDAVIEKYLKKIDDIKKIVNEEGDNIYQIMETKANEFGFEIKTHPIDRNNILMGLNNTISQALRADNVFDWINTHYQPMAGIQENVLNCLNDIIKQQDVAESIDKIKSEYDEFDKILSELGEKVVSISDAIRNGYYDKIADCCPTYITILRKFW